MRTLGSLLDVISTHGQRPAVFALHEEGMRTWSYKELADHGRRLAGGLIRTGVTGGDRVALLAANSPEWIIACLGIVGVGAVVTPVDVQLEDEALARILNHCGAEIVFTTAEQAGRLENLDVTVSPILLDVGGENPRSWRRLLAKSGRDAIHASREPDEPAALFYTSGTTGAPKGVPLSHANLVFQIHAIIGADVVTREDHMLLPLPLHHVYPFVMGMLAPLTLGLTIILPLSLAGPQLVRAFKEGEVSVIVGVPRLYSALYAGIQERAGSGGKMAAGFFGLSTGLSTLVRRRTRLDAGKRLMRPLRERLGPRLRLLASGGAPLDPDLAEKLEGMGWRIAIGYGLTETSPLLTLKRPDGKKLGSVGQPMPGIEVRIDPSAMPKGVLEQRREEAKTARPHQEGEILAKGPGVFSGYLNLPEETGEVFTEDGWFRTRDLGYVDKDDYLYVTGRVSTLIVTDGGNNVQPEEVEEAYQLEPVIRDIGVLQRDGRLAAVIVPDLDEIRRRGVEIDRTIRQAVEESSMRLPSYQRISTYAITRQPLERTQLGKIRRHLLEERFDVAQRGAEGVAEALGPIPMEEMQEEDRALLENQAARSVWELLANRYPDRRLTPDTSPQLDLDIDSLGWVDLTLEFARSAGVELSEKAIGRIYSVRDLLRETARQGRTRVTSRGLPLENPEKVLSLDQKRWMRALGPVESALARGMFVLNRVIARKVFELRVEGIGHLPEDGPFVLASNHTSSLDPCAIAAALDDRRLLHTYWGSRADTAFSNPLRRQISRLAHVVPIDPHAAIFSSLAFGAAVLEHQNNLVWFPEGRRSHSGELLPFRPGIGMLLHRFPVPLVPVIVRGTHEAMPPGKAWPRPRKILVVFGKPLDPRELERHGEGEQPQSRIVNALFEHVAKMVDAIS